MKAALSSAVLSYLLAVNAVKTKLEVNEASVPSQAEQDEVTGIANDMKQWGGVTAGAANIGMYMKGNHMKMVNTDFSFTGAIGSSAVPESTSGGVTKREIKFGGCRMGKYMQDDSMEMSNSKLDINGVKETDATIRVAALVQTPSLVQMGAASPTNMYMYKDTLSMDRTIFTMNVGAAASGFLQESASSHASHGASVMNLQELNINMYMYGNEMTMTDTNFQMNVQGFPFTPSMQAAGVIGGDLARLLLLNLGTMSSAVQDMDVQFGQNRETSDTEKVWSWMKGWTTSSTVNGKSANINMHMYHNKMSMDKTHFKMDVGAELSAGLALEKVVQKQGANSSASPVAAEGVKLARQGEAGAASSAMAPKEWKLYNTGMDMQDKEVTFTAGSFLQEGARKDSAGPVPGPGSDINMYMYENQMSMKNTKFTMNVGSGGSGLLQESSQLEGASRRMVMNAGKLNVKMYMYENEMTMKDTVFSWTVAGR